MLLLVNLQETFEYSNILLLSNGRTLNMGFSIPKAGLRGPQCMQIHREKGWNVFSPPWPAAASTELVLNVYRSVLGRTAISWAFFKCTMFSVTGSARRLLLRSVSLLFLGRETWYTPPPGGNQNPGSACPAWQPVQHRCATGLEISCPHPQQWQWAITKSHHRFNFLRYLQAPKIAPPAA